MRSKAARNGFPISMNARCRAHSPQPVQGIADDLKAALTRAGARDVRVAEQRVAGLPGLRADYTMKSTSVGIIDGRQYHVLGGDRGCAISFAAPKGELPKEAGRIADTVEIVA